MQKYVGTPSLHSIYTIILRKKNIIEKFPIFRVATRAFGGGRPPEIQNLGDMWLGDLLSCIK